MEKFNTTFSFFYYNLVNVGCYVYSQSISSSEVVRKGFSSCFRNEAGLNVFHRWEIVPETFLQCGLCSARFNSLK